MKKFSPPFSQWAENLRRRFIAVLLIAGLCLASACTGESYTKYQREFYDLFDTVTVVIIYARNGSEFEKYYRAIYDEMYRLNMFYDIYNDYEGINNIKTINDSAGLAPVSVDSSIIDLLEEARLAYDKSGGTANVALGSVLKIWHEYREAGISNAEAASLPPMERLEEAYLHTDITDMELDRQTSTVFLHDPEMSLDVGAFAKGYAVQRAVDKAKEAGMISGLISAGGNVAVVGMPMDGRETWSVGIRTPDSMSTLFDAVNVTDMAAVTSGDYERFYTVDGIPYHHIIDPSSLMPARLYRSVTIIHPDSGVGDMLSTAVFILPQPEGERLAKEFGAEVLWILSDNSVAMTKGYKEISSLP